ncbi:MAG TPA: carbohydrate porin [Rhizomicrobium sp.]|jgi:porin|nr:carbohydrate porin [Rhizomicrobium sp.]
MHNAHDSLQRGLVKIARAAITAAVLDVCMWSMAFGQTVTDPTKPAAPSPTPSPNPGPPGPFTFTAAAIVDLLGDAMGGKDAGEFGYVHLLKLSAAYDGATDGLPGLTGLVSVAHVSGSDFSADDVGSVQDISASEAEPGGLRLYEAWVQQEMDDGIGGIKAGLIDINTTFDVQETAALFLNASQGIGPDISDTGVNGPSDYPRPAPAIAAFYRPAEDWTAQLGVFDGAAGNPADKSAFFGVRLDGALIIGQLERRFGDVARVEAGLWSYTAAFPLLGLSLSDGSTPTSRDNNGLYSLVEGRLLPKSNDDQGGLSGWVRVGVANGNINEVANYLGAGLVYTGLIEGRDKDEIGLAIARAGFGGGAHNVANLEGQPIGDAETDLEATYRYAFSDWLNIQPDVQYVVSPHGDLHVQNAFVVGVRLAFTYTR